MRLCHFSKCRRELPSWPDGLDITLTKHRRHLGPRTIPSIQSMLSALLALISRPAVTASTATAAFAVVSCLVETVPTFISAKQLSSILLAAIESRERHEESSSALISVCAKKIPTKVLFPVVMDLWKEVHQGQESVSLSVRTT